MPYTEPLWAKAELVNNAFFTLRIKGAVMEQAFDVLAEDPAVVEGWPNRGSLAGQVLGSPDEFVQLFNFPVSITDSVAAAYLAAKDDAAHPNHAKPSDAVTDTQIRDAVAASWNEVAGYRAPAV